MGLGRMILLFQAVVTIMISVAFFSQLIILDSKQIGELKIEMSKGFNIFSEDAPRIIVDIKKRYTVAAYTLLTVAIIEILLLSRIFR